MDINAEISDMRVALASLEAKAKAQQEPTLTPVSFESKGELAKALIDGRTFKTPAGATLMYGEDTSFSSPFQIIFLRKNKDAMIDVWNLYADLQEINAASEEPWYLNIPPEGVECYVSNVYKNPSAHDSTRLVMRYDLYSLRPFRIGVTLAHRGDYKYATPVNKGK